jgi:uncharacterized LabA/DUF88 family protein
MENNFAFIDSQNVNLGIRGAGWKLDFEKFRIYLKDKYHVSRAYVFLGYVSGNNGLYTALQRMGYVCIFKPIVEYAHGKIKGNCDAELVLQTMIDFDRYKQAIIATGDGDFYCLLNHLQSRNKLGPLFIPNKKKFSSLLKTRGLKPYLRYMDDLKDKLSMPIKKEGPRKDKTLRS